MDEPAIRPRLKNEVGHIHFPHIDARVSSEADEELSREQALAQEHRIHLWATKDDAACDTARRPHPPPVKPVLQDRCPVDSGGDMPRRREPGKLGGFLVRQVVGQPATPGLRR